MNPVVRQLSQYASDKMFAAMSGNYKDFKNASKAFGKLASENLELLPQVKAPKASGIPNSEEKLRKKRLSLNTLETKNLKKKHTNI